MSEYQKTVRLTAHTQGLFDSFINYFQSLGYSVTNAIPPSRIELSKKGTVWTLDEIDGPHKLTIYLNAEGEETVVTFDFYCAMGVGDFTERSRRTIDSEIHTLCGSIAGPAQDATDTSLPDRICVKCRKGIPMDAEFCTHCGYDFGGTQ